MIVGLKTVPSISYLYQSLLLRAPIVYCTLFVSCSSLTVVSASASFIYKDGSLDRLQIGNNTNVVKGICFLYCVLYWDIGFVLGQKICPNTKIVPP